MIEIGLKIQLLEHFFLLESISTKGEALLTPTRIYVKHLLPILKSGRVKAVAHITGGGLIENIPRALPHSIGVTLDATQWSIPPVFAWLATLGISIL